MHVEELNQKNWAPVMDDGQYPLHQPKSELDEQWGHGRRPLSKVPRRSI
jgi:hypothetical protein